MIKYLFIHAISTFILFTVWVNNLGLSGGEIGMAPIGFALLLMILLALGISLVLLFRKQFQDRNSMSIGFIIYLLMFQLLPFFGGESWLAGITDQGPNGMINRAFVLAPLVTGFLTWIIIFLREPKRANHY